MRIKGFLAERRAEHYLKKQGLTPITRNFACKCGEIDLIMQDQEVLVFIEVRSRSYADYGDALESVDFIKQQKLLNTADFFLQQRKLLDYVDVRFDVVAIDEGRLRWVRDILN